MARRNLYLQFLFAWLAGNGDLHAKNASLLQDPSGAWRVAPMYDLPCTALYRDFTMALRIVDRDSKLKAQHWREFADSIGLPQRAATSAMTLALQAADAIDLSCLPFEGSPLNGARRELDFRRSRLRLDLA